MKGVGRCTEIHSTPTCVCVRGMENHTPAYTLPESGRSTTKVRSRRKAIIRVEQVGPDIHITAPIWAKPTLRAIDGAHWDPDLKVWLTEDLGVAEVVARVEADGYVAHVYDRDRSTVERMVARNEAIRRMRRSA